MHKTLITNLCYGHTTYTDTTCDNNKAKGTGQRYRDAESLYTTETKLLVFKLDC